MSRIAYVNGRYMPSNEAKVPVEDRGYQFADGVYEVCEVRGGRLVDERRHMARLDRPPAAPRPFAWGPANCAPDVASPTGGCAARDNSSKPGARWDCVCAGHAWR